MLDDIISFINYLPLLVLITRAEFVTMPNLSWEMFHRAQEKSRLIREVVYEKKKFAMHIRRLDMVAGAIKNDGSDPKHPALYDSITSYVNPIKKDLKDLYEEGLRYSIMTDQSLRNTTNCEYHFRYDQSGV